MKTARIKLDDETVSSIDRAGKKLGLKRSQIVREALRGWLRRQAVDRFERQWITALRKRVDEPARSEDWLDPQAWSQE